MAQIYVEGIGYIEIPDFAADPAAAAAPAPAPTPAPPPPPAPAPAAPSFDASAYLAQNPDIAAYAAANGLDANQFATQHYNTTGKDEIAAGGRQLYATPSGGGSTPASAAQTPAAAAAQVAASGVNPASLQGLAAMAAALAAQQQPQAQAAQPQAFQAPSAFDAMAYLEANPDVAAYAKANNLDATKFASDHWYGAGQAEGRSLGTSKASSRIDEPGPMPGSGLPTYQQNALTVGPTSTTPAATTPSVTSNAFSAQAYLDQNPDIAWAAQLSGQDPLQFAAQHYNSQGKQEVAAGTRYLSAQQMAQKQAEVAKGGPVTPGATWADFYTKVPGVQEWATRAMQAEWAPPGWAGGPIDSMEEAAAAYQSIYGDGGTGIRFAAKDPSKYFYDENNPDLNTRGLLDAQGNLQVIDAKALANPNIHPFSAQAQAATAGTPTDAQWAAYTNQYSDLAAAAKAAGQDAATFGRQHYLGSGRSENRAVPGFDAGAELLGPATAPKAGVSWTDPTKADIKANGSQIAGQLYKAGTTVTFDDGHTMTPGNDYYVAYTNSGDPTAVLGATPGAQYAVIDPKTKEVLFYGVGAEGAKGAAEMATGLSQDKGRKANWQIAVNYTGGTEDEDWQLAGYDKKDPKNSVLGSIARIVLPIAGALLLPGIGAGLGIGGLTAASGAATTLGTGLGAAVGSLGASAINGDSLKQALLGAAVSGLGAAFIPKIPGFDAVSKAVSNIPGMNVLNSGLGALQNAGNSIGSALGGGAAGASSAVSSVAASAVGTAVPISDLISPALNVALVNTPATLASAVGQGLITQAGSKFVEQAVSTAIADAGGATVAPIVVQAATKALLPLALAGASAATLASAATGLFNQGSVEEIEVTARKIQEDLKGNIAAGAGTYVEPIEVTAAKPDPVVNRDELVTTQGGNVLPHTLDSAPAQTSGETWKDKLTDPWRLAAAAALLGGGLGGGGGGNGEYSSSFTGGTRPGTRGSLGEIFTTGDLPAPTMGMRTGTGLAVNEGYGYGGEGAFFSDVVGGTGGGGSMFAAASSPFQVASPFAATNFAATGSGSSGISAPLAADLSSLGFDAGEDDFGDWIASQPETVKARVRDMFRARGRTPTFKRGGKVRGKGSGRADKIPALLSADEYVIDAETVALLGDGSSAEGAKQLDRFRVNVRKQKGKQLAKGRFSADAKAPEHYLRGV